MGEPLVLPPPRWMQERDEAEARLAASLPLHPTRSYAKACEWASVYAAQIEAPRPAVR